MTKWKECAKQHSTFALYNQDTVQNNEPTSFSLPNNMVKRYMGPGDERSKLRCRKRQDSDWSSQQTKYR